MSVADATASAPAGVTGRRPRTRRTTGVLAVVAGAAMALSLPPWGWWPLGPLGAGALAVALVGRRARTRFAAALLAFVVLYAVSMWWVVDLHAGGYAIVVLGEALLMAAIVGLTPPGRSAAVGFPAVLVLAEAVRWSVPFGGVPVSNLALGQVGGPLIDTARLATALTVVSVVALLGAALARATAADRRAAAGLVLTAAAVVAAGHLAPRGHEVDTLEVAAVQGGGPLGTRARDTAEGIVFERHLAATAGVSTPVDLVLWPEDVVGVRGSLVGSPEADELAAVARSLDAVLVVGAVESLTDTFRNAAVVVTSDGRIGDRYDKRNRVPFGEYVPFRSFVDRFADLSFVPRDALVGPDPTSLDTPLGRFAAPISFELFFPRRARSGVQEGAVLLLGPTNASSYTNTIIPEQTLASSRLRAVENGRWLVQAAPTGYSAVVDEEGRVHERTGLREATVVQGTVELRRGDTYATRVGRVPLLWAAAVSLAGAWWWERRRRRLTPRPGG